MPFKNDKFSEKATFSDQKPWEKSLFLGRFKVPLIYARRTKKSSPDIINFYVELAGHDKVSDADKAATCWLEFKAPSLKTKNEGPFENMSFKGKTN